jgi:chemotaxis protein histidine kinase CheA
LRARLIVQHPNDHWDKRSDKEILDSLLISNISSRERATIYSGRGVGVCSVYAEVLKAGGSMSLASVKNQGTLVTIEFPYFLEFR